MNKSDWDSFKVEKEKPLKKAGPIAHACIVLAGAALGVVCTLLFFADGSPIRLWSWFALSWKGQFLILAAGAVGGGCWTVWFLWRYHQGKE